MRMSDIKLAPSHLRDQNGVQFEREILKKHQEISSNYKCSSASSYQKETSASPGYFTDLNFIPQTAGRRL